MKNLTRLGFALAIFGGTLAVAPRLHEAYVLIKLLCLAAGGALIWTGLLRKPAARTALDVPLAALGASILVSTFFSADRPSSLFGVYPQMMYGALQIALYAALFYGAAAASGDDEASGELAIWMLAATIPLSLFGISQRLFGDVLTGFAIPDGKRITSTIGSPIMLGACLVLLIPLALDGALRRKSRLGASALALMSVALIMTWSRGAWLGAVAASGFYLWATGRLRLRPRQALIIGAASLVFLYGASRLLIKADSDSLRIETAKTALTAFKARPLTGFGPDTFLIAFRRFKTDKFLQVTHGTITESLNAHNDFLQAAATLGALGLAAYLWLMWALAVRFHERLSRPDPDGVDAAIAAGLFGLFLQAKVNPIPPTAVALAAIMAGMICRERKTLSPAAGRAAASLTAVLCAACALLLARFCEADRLFHEGWHLTSTAALTDPQFTAGVNDLRRATEINPWVGEYLSKRIDVTLRVAPHTPPEQGKQLMEKALRLTQDGIRMHPEDATAHVLFATSLALSKHYGGLMMPEAFAEIKVASSLDPTFTYTLRRRMDIARELGDQADFERTRAEYLRVIGLTGEEANFTPLIY